MHGLRGASYFCCPDLQGSSCPPSWRVGHQLVPTHTFPHEVVLYYHPESPMTQPIHGCVSSHYD
jgi:hypothetical protein